MCDKPEYIVKYKKEMNNYIDGVCLFWLNPPEIHIAEKHRNRKYGALILQHELTHLKFVKLARKHTIYRKFILLNNNIWDFFDMIRILIISLNSRLRRFR